MVTLPKHPTYPDTERLVLIGDLVVEPNGMGAEHGLVPSTVISVDQKYIGLRSIVTGATKNTYPCLIRPATDSEVEAVDERLTPEAIDDWKSRMTKMGAMVLVIQEPTSSTKKRRHMVLLPAGHSLRDMRPRDIVAPFVDESRIDNYDHDDLFLTAPNDLRLAYEFEEVMFQEPVRIEAEPMTPVERAFHALDRIMMSGIVDEDTTDIEYALKEMAEKLGIEVPKRDYIERYDDWDDDYDYY